MDRDLLDLETLRVPALRLPSFVTPDFLRHVMPLTNRDLRIIHDRYGATIRDMTGFAWPNEKPSLDEFYELLPKALAYPGFALLFGLYIPREVRDRGRGPMPRQVRNQFMSVLIDDPSLLEDRVGSVS